MQEKLDGIMTAHILQGIINHLDYIHDLGFTAIWLKPALENIMAKPLIMDTQLQIIIKLT